MRTKHVLDDPTPSPRPAKRESPDSSGMATPPSPATSSDSMPGLTSVTEFTSPYFTSNALHSRDVTSDSSGGGVPLSAINIASVLDTEEDIDTSALLSMIGSDGTLAPTIDDDVLKSISIAALASESGCTTPPPISRPPPSSSSSAEAFSQTVSPSTMKDGSPGPSAETQATRYDAPAFQPTIYRLSHLAIQMPMIPEHVQQFFVSSTAVVSTWTNFDAFAQSWFNESDSRFSSCGKLNLSPREQANVSRVMNSSNDGAEDERLFGNVRFDVGTAFRTLSILHIAFLHDGEAERLECKRGIFVRSADNATVVNITIDSVYHYQQVDLMMRKVAFWLRKRMKNGDSLPGLSMEDVEFVASLFVFKADAPWRA